MGGTQSTNCCRPIVEDDAVPDAKVGIMPADEALSFEAPKTIWQQEDAAWKAAAAENTDDADAPVSHALAPPVVELSNGQVAVVPYFRLKDAAKFQELCQARRAAGGGARYDCRLSEDGAEAHWREVYANGEGALEQMADMDKQMAELLDGPAELDRVEVHGPEEELGKMRDTLQPLGCVFRATAEQPTSRQASKGPAMVKVSSLKAREAAAAPAKEEAPAEGPLTEAEVSAVQRSWAKAAELGAEAVGVLLFRNIFEIAPNAIELFPFKGEAEADLYESSSLKKHGLRVVNTVSTAVAGLHSLPELVPVLKDLGTRHVGYSVQRPHYEVVGQALMRTLKAGLGKDFTPEVEAAWLKLWPVVADTMMGDHYGKDAKKEEQKKVRGEGARANTPAKKPSAKKAAQPAAAAAPASGEAPPAAAEAPKKKASGEKAAPPASGEVPPAAAEAPKKKASGKAKPAPKEVVLSEAEISIIESSWAQAFALGAEAVGVLLFKQIFEIAPEALQLFPFKADPIIYDGQLKTHSAKVVTAVDQVVASVRDLGALAVVLQDLGQRHVGYNVAPPHYDVVGQALLRTLQLGLKDVFTKEAEAAWTKFWAFIAKSCISGNYGSEFQAPDAKKKAAAKDTKRKPKAAAPKGAAAGEDAPAPKEKKALKKKLTEAESRELLKDLIALVKAGRSAEAENLLAKGLDVNFSDADGNTALHVAAQEGKLESVKVLLANRADPAAQVKLGEWGNTPLHLAAKAAHRDVCEALVAADKKGKALQLKNRQGKMPADLATSKLRSFLKKQAMATNEEAA